MGPIGHFSVGLAAKPAAAKIPLVRRQAFLPVNDN